MTAAASAKMVVVQNEPREVGPIEGREVYRDAPYEPPSAAPPPPPPPTAPPSPPPAPPTGSPMAPPTGPPTNLPAPRTGPTMWEELKASRGKDVPNSRPLPDWVKRFSWVLDDLVRVPGTADRRVGVDGLVSIIPVAGDAIGIGLSMIIVMVGVAAGVSIPTIVRMLLWVGLEALVGLVPFLGPVFNMVFKANNRNVALIERDLADRQATRRSSLAVIGLTVLVACIGMAMLVVFTVLSLLVLIWAVSKLVSAIPGL